VRVLLVANYERDRQQSMLRYARLLERGIADAGHDLALIRPEPLFGRLGRHSSAISKWLSHIDKFILFPFRLRKQGRDADLVHIVDHGNALLGRWVADRPCVITCHDLFAVRAARGEFEKYRVRWSGRVLQEASLAALRRFDHVACVSKATAGDVLRLAGLPQAKVTVVHSALNYHYCPMSLEEASFRLARLGLEHGRFFLHVGGNNWRKNRIGALALLAEIRKFRRYEELRLVMVGPEPSPDVRRAAARLPAGAVMVVTEIGDEDMRALYSCAAALLAVSIFEGFCWPIIEAQACGCPVFASDVPPLPEVGGSGALYINPQDLAGAAHRISQQLIDTRELRAAGFENASRFSRAQMMAGYIRIYDAILERARTGAALAEERVAMGSA
jgi:glycosyltransferase involved in cell wall biosynthesis